MGLLEREGGVFYGFLADIWDIGPVLVFAVEFYLFGPDEGRIRNGGQRILDVGYAVRVGVIGVGFRKVEILDLAGVPGAHSAAGPDGLANLIEVIEGAVCFWCVGIVAVLLFREGAGSVIGDVVFVLVRDHDGFTEIVAEPLDVGESAVGYGDAGPVFAELAAAVPGEFIIGTVGLLVTEAVGEVVENDTVVFLIETGKVGLGFYFVMVFVGGKPGDVVAEELGSARNAFRPAVNS